MRSPSAVPKQTCGRLEVLLGFYTFVFVDNFICFQYRTMVLSCKVFGCKSSSRDKNRLYKLHYFPKEREKRDRWAKMCGYREGDDVPLYARICSLHFVGGQGPSEEYPDPVPNVEDIENEVVPGVQNLPISPRVVDASLALLHLSEDGQEQRSNEDVINSDSDDGIAPLDEVEVRVQASPHHKWIVTPTRAAPTYEPKERSTLDVSEAAAVPSSPLYAEESEAASTSKSWQVTPASTKAGCSSSVHGLESTGPRSHHASRRLPFSASHQEQPIQGSERRRKPMVCRCQPVRKRHNERLGKRVMVGRRPFLSYEVCKNFTVKTFRRLTGLTQANFLVLYNFLGGDEVCTKLKYNYAQSTPKTSKATLSPKDRLLLTLMRLRRGWTGEDIALFFKVSPAVASKTFFVWIQFLYLEFKRIQEAMFVTRLDQQESIPACYKPFKNFRVTVDTTEVRIQVPTHYKQQGNTYSSYKAGNVINFLIGVSCWGGISFISPGFEGNMSDKQIFLQSGIRNFLIPEDLILADRGFNIAEELSEDRVKLVHPPFMSDRTALSVEEELLTKQIAAARIHVERAIRKIKCFHLLKNITNKLLPILDQMVYVAGCLVNFDRPIVS